MVTTAGRDPDTGAVRRLTPTVDVATEREARADGVLLLAEVQSGAVGQGRREGDDGGTGFALPLAAGSGSTGSGHSEAKGKPLSAKTVKQVHGVIRLALAQG